MRFTDVVDSLIENYNSLDVRIIAYYDGLWKAVLTITRFRVEPVEQVKREHERLKKFGLIWNDKFRVGLYTFSITEWVKIRSDLEKGLLGVQTDFAVNIPSEDLNREVADSPSTNWLDTTNREWYSYMFKSVPPRGIEQKILTDQSVLSKEKGFGDIFEHLSAILEVKSSDIMWTSPINIVIVPILFKIHNAEFIDKSITLKGKWVPNQNIKLTINIYEREPNGQQGNVKQQIPLYLEYRDGRVIDDWQIKKSVDVEPIDDEPFEVTVTCKGLLLQRYGGRRTSNMSKKDGMTVRPALHTFQDFVSLSELKEMLLNVRAKDIKDDRLIFERAVSWLVSLLRCNAIWLNRPFDKSVKNPKISVDILGSVKNRLLLVNATTGILGPEDVTAQLSNKMEFKKEVAGTDIEILPILISAQTVEPLRKAVGENEVRLIGKNELERILEFLEKGLLEEAQYYLLNAEPAGFGISLSQY